jgi:hypothetical protein
VSGFEFSKIEQIKKNHNYIKFDEFDGINFNFGFLNLNISNSFENYEIYWLELVSYFELRISDFICNQKHRIRKKQTMGFTE